MFGGGVGCTHCTKPFRLRTRVIAMPGEDDIQGESYFVHVAHVGRHGVRLEGPPLKAVLRCGPPGGDNQEPVGVWWELRRVVGYTHPAYKHPWQAIKANLQLWRRLAAEVRIPWDEAYRPSLKSAKARQAQHETEWEFSSSLGTMGLLVFLAWCATKQRGLDMRPKAGALLQALVSECVEHQSIDGLMGSGQIPNPVGVCECSCRLPQRRHGDVESCETIVNLAQRCSNMLDSSGPQQQRNRFEVAVDMLLLLYNEVDKCALVVEWVRYTFGEVGDLLLHGLQHRGARRVGDPSSLELRGPLKRRTRDCDVDRFCHWGALEAKRTKTAGTFLQSRDECSTNSTRSVAKFMGEYQAAGLLTYHIMGSVAYAADASRVGQPPVDLLFGFLTDWRSKSAVVVPPQVRAGRDQMHLGGGGGGQSNAQHHPGEC